MSKVIVEALYIGERVTGFGEIVQAFKIENGEVLHWTGVKGLWVDESYEVEVKPTGGHTIKMRPDRVEEKDRRLFMSDKDKIEYEAQKIAVRGQRERRKKKMELSKPHADIVKAIQLLKPFARSLDYIDLDRFMGYVKNQLSKKPNTKTKRRK